MPETGLAGPVFCCRAGLAKSKEGEAMQTIISKDNQYLKMARAVHTKKGRQEYGCYLLEGLRLVGEALDHGAPVFFALFAASALVDQRMTALAERMQAQSLPCAMISDELFANISATEHPQGVAALANFMVPALHGPDEEQHCFIYTDEISDPGNLGSIIRSAHAANAAGLILSRSTADIYNPKVLRSAMGATLKLPMFRVSHNEQAFELMRELGLSIFVAAAEGVDIRQAGLDLTAPHVWVLGGEADGAAPFWRERADALVRLPMREGAESLNVAAAAAVLLYQSYLKPAR